MVAKTQRLGRKSRPDVGRKQKPATSKPDEGSEPLKDPRREGYCQEVVSGSTGGEAAIKAGYSPGGSGAQSSRLLKNAQVVARIAHLRQAIAQQVVAETAVDRAQVLRWLQEHRQLAIIAGDIGPANKAAELIGKAVDPGMFSEHIEMGGNLKVNFNIKTGAK